MPNLALVTRPNCFAEVIGQEKPIDQTINYLNDLQNNLDERATPIILSGPRGTGKTTTGRLIAKYLNCQNNQNDLTIVCECSNCSSIMNDPESAIDYLELDGASNNGVNDIEAVIKTTFYSPIGNWKIILIDECHMLTRPAWNSLLKQLEEPPLHVLYILATTEENKIIPTVKSRSKMRRFSLLDHETIVQQLFQIVNNPNWIEDNTDFDNPEILDFIASMAKGSLRDAITFLGDVLNLSDRSLVSIQQSVGSADAKKAGHILKLLFEDNIGQALIELFALEKDGIDPKSLMEQSQLLLADILNVKSKAEVTRILPVDYYKERFGNVNISHIASTLKVFLEISGVAQSSITYVTLTYAIVAGKNSMIQSTIENTPVTHQTLATPSYPSTQSTEPTTSDKLAQLFKQNEKIEPARTGPSPLPAPQPIEIKEQKTSQPVIKVEEEEAYF